MLAFLAQSCYNAITGSVWSSSPRWLNNFTSTDDPRVFWYCYYQMREDLSYMKIMDYAREIKSRLTMPEMMLHYGFELDRAGFCKCPLHSEKSGSFKAYPGDRGFSCFGCGAHGSVIDFVMLYFGLSFKDALVKINDDFSLGLPIGEKMDRRKQLEMQRQAFMRKREMNAKKAEQERLENAYWEAFDEWKRLDDNRRNYAPKTPSEPLHPLFVEALKNIAGAEYNLSCAEIARYEYENRNSRNS